MTSSHRLVLATTASHFTFPIFGCNYILTCLRVIPNEISSYFWVNKYRTGLSLGQLLWFCYLRDMSLDAKNCESMHAGKSHIYLAKCIKLFWVVLTVSNFPHDKPVFTFFFKKKKQLLTRWQWLLTSYLSRTHRHTNTASVDLVLLQVSYSFWHKVTSTMIVLVRYLGEKKIWQ